MIKIISQLSHNNRGELVSHRQKVHLQQGDMDGACSVYSLMMLLIILKIISREVAANIWMSVDGRTREGKLVKYINSSGLFRNGKEMSGLSDEFNEIYGKVCTSQCHYKDKDEMYGILKKEIDADRPCLIGIKYNDEGAGHALTAVGYEEDSSKRKILCLDPGYPAPLCGYWNAIIELDKYNSDYSDYYMPNCVKVLFDGVITFR